MAYDHFVERAHDPSSAYDRLLRAYGELDLRDGVSSLMNARELLRNKDRR
jgi:glycine C-acetyltransferase